MEIRSNYIINEATSLIYPEYDETGKLLSVVMENGVLFKVGLGPTQLVDYSLRCYGSSLRGANDGARMLLGEISMPPIVLGLGKKLYWLPTKSPYKEDCVWMAANHVKDYTLFGKKMTCIVLNDNSEFILESSYYAFDQKMKRTFLLKYKVESQFRVGVVLEREATYLIRRKGKERNYRKFEKE